MKKGLWGCMALVLLIPSAAFGRKEGPRTGPTTFGVSPPEFELEADAGQDIKATFKIENPLNVTSRYTMATNGMILSKSGLVTKPLSSLPADHIARSLKFETLEIVIPPRSEKTIAFTVSVPVSAKGTQYAGFTVSRSPDDSAALAQSTDYERHYGLGMEPALGVTIKVFVKGTLYAYKLEAVNVKPGTASRPPVVVAAIRNTGDGELRINPILILTDAAGKVGVRMKSEGIVTVVPGGKVNVTFQSPGRSIAAGQYKAILSVPDAKYQLSPSEISVSLK